VKWLLAGLVLLLFPPLAGCTNRNEITLITRTTAHRGLIFIGGSVNNPGLYPYSEDDLLSDLIGAAGGLKNGADNSDVELSFGAQDSPQKIDINRAEAWLLEALPDIGAATAKNIVAYREANGLFRNLSDLLKVPGIGAVLLSKIAPYIVVGGD
jgi:competence protein ComEA